MDQEIVAETEAPALARSSSVRLQHRKPMIRHLHSLLRWWWRGQPRSPNAVRACHSEWRLLAARLSRRIKWPYHRTTGHSVRQCRAQLHDSGGFACKEIMGLVRVLSEIE